MVPSIILPAAETIILLYEPSNLYIFGDNDIYINYYVQGSGGIKEQTIK